MKKFCLALLAILLSCSTTFAQLLSDKTSNKITIGYDVYTDFQTNLKDITTDYKSGKFNPGFNVYATYNFNVGESNHVFAIGAGLRAQNFYSNAMISNIYADSIAFQIFDNGSYKRSKINLTYLDIPLEMRFRIKDQFKIGIGFKVGINIASKTKFVGTLNSTETSVKYMNINGLEQYTYGVTFRVGWKWINGFVYYQPTRVFSEGSAGPAISPLSVGFTVTPF